MWAPRHYIFLIILISSQLLFVTSHDHFWELNPWILTYWISEIIKCQIKSSHSDEYILPYIKIQAQAHILWYFLTYIREHNSTVSLTTKYWFHADIAARIFNATKACNVLQLKSFLSSIPCGWLREKIKFVQFIIMIICKSRLYRWMIRFAKALISLRWHWSTSFIAFD